MNRRSSPQKAVRLAGGQMMKYTRWQLWRKLLACGVGSAGDCKPTVCDTSAAGLPSAQHLWSVIGVSAAMLFFVFSAQAQTDVKLNSIGGDGGSRFVARCPQGQLLTGVELRAGDDVDAIRPLCVTAYGPADVGPFQPYMPGIPGFNQTFYGGDGGSRVDLACPRGFPIITGMYVRAEGKEIISVNNIHLFCGIAGTTQENEVDANFDAPEVEQAGIKIGSGFGTNPSSTQGTERCPAGLVAVGINGRSGKWLDAVGLICGEPKLTPRAAPPPPEAPPRPAVKAIGRVKVPTTPGTTPSPPRPICDMARDARARNNAAASGLEEKCRADLAAKGAAIAQVDPIVAQARAGETDALYQQGFDIATGIFGDPALGAKGNTATGAGSLGIRDQLTAAGQRGFNASVKLHLSRKYERTSATITANPNPVMVSNGQTSGATTITWKAAPTYTYCEIYLSVDHGQWSEFARGGDGSKTTTIKLGSSHTFRMMVYEGQAGTPKVITTLTVTAKN